LSGKYGQNFEELGSEFEGDLILTEDQKNGIPGNNYRWPGNTVYYSMEGGFGKLSKKLIRKN